METSNFSNVTKAEYEVKEALSKLKDAKQKLERDYIELTKKNIIVTMREENEFSERALEMLLESLSRQIKDLYEDK